jgi:hypothetical protein
MLPRPCVQPRGIGIGNSSSRKRGSRFALRGERRSVPGRGWRRRRCWNRPDTRYRPASNQACWVRHRPQRLPHVDWEMNNRVSWVPIGFTQSLRMAYSRTFCGTGYYIYHQFVEGAKLSRPIAPWDGTTPPTAPVAIWRRQEAAASASSPDEFTWRPIPRPRSGAMSTVRRSFVRWSSRRHAIGHWHSPRRACVSPGMATGQPPSTPRLRCSMAPAVCTIAPTANAPIGSLLPQTIGVRLHRDRWRLCSGARRQSTEPNPG